jgi:hypothetical protein
MADLGLRRRQYRCCCENCGFRASGHVARDHRAINRVLAMLDERRRRLLAGLLAWRGGRGGIVAVATITGLSRTTIRRGVEELRRGVAAGGRIRQPGGGRQSVEKKIPG